MDEAVMRVAFRLVCDNQRRPCLYNQVYERLGVGEADPDQA